MMPKRTKPKRLPAAERRATTVETVLELAGERNPSDITTASITDRMGMTEGVLFRHFPSKDALWKSVMEWVADQLLQRVEQATQEAESPLLALEGVFMAHIEFVVAHPGVPRMLFSELQRAEDTPAKRVTRALLARYTKHLVDVIEDGKARGELAATLNTRDAATLFVGIIQGLVMQSLLAGTAARMRSDAPGVFAIYRRGIGGVQ
jgi:AcrR family transcriptional regulator